MELRLLVLRTSNPEKLAQFYAILGLIFENHIHGNSPLHYSAEIGQTVLEIYPFTKDQNEADKNLRLGFAIDHWDKILWKLKNEYNIKFLMEPAKTEFGFMAIIEDPDGRKVELYRKNLKGFKIKINRFVDPHQPGFVECSVVDVFGKEHFFIEKVPVVSMENLDLNSDYPKDGVLACEIIKKRKDNFEKIVYTVSSVVWGIETIEGLEEFDLFEEQLTEIER